VSRARREAESRSLSIDFRVADITSLDAIPERDFDVVTALDNALPHLSEEHLSAALRAMHLRLHPGSIFLASTRDYDELIQQRPTIQGPFLYGAQGNRRIVLQVWDWIETARYRLQQYITTEQAGAWETQHFVSDYRCLLREELASALRSAGFQQIEWLTPAESGFYQPVIVATRPQSECQAG
jgi:glycine/sarcosine N-methyltransferase